MVDEYYRVYVLSGRARSLVCRHRLWSPGPVRVPYPVRDERLSESFLSVCLPVCTGGGSHGRGSPRSDTVPREWALYHSPYNFRNGGTSAFGVPGPGQSQCDILYDHDSRRRRRLFPISPNSLSRESVRRTGQVWRRGRGLGVGTDKTGNDGSARRTSRTLRGFLSTLAYGSCDYRRKPTRVFT